MNIFNLIALFTRKPIDFDSSRVILKLLGSKLGLTVGRQGVDLTRAEYVKGVVSPIQIGGQENYEIKI